jgi:putative endonuclease
MDCHKLRMHGCRSLSLLHFHSGSTDAFTMDVHRSERRFVYVLRSESDPAHHYVGLSADVRKRLQWHNAGQNVHTARNRPWRIVVSLEFTSEQAAFRFERYLKSGSGRAFAKRHFS